jgi:hypothetical protein
MARLWIVMQDAADLARRLVPTAAVRGCARLSAIVILPLALAACPNSGGYEGWVNRDNQWPGSKASLSAIEDCQAEPATSLDDCMRSKGWRYGFPGLM